MATPAAGRPAQPSPKKEADRAKEDALLQKASAVRVKFLYHVFKQIWHDQPREHA